MEKSRQERLENMINQCDNGIKGLDNGVIHIERKIYDSLRELERSPIFYSSLDKNLEELLMHKKVGKKEIEAIKNTRVNTKAIIDEYEKKIENLKNEYSAFKYNDQERKDEQKFQRGLDKRKDEFFQALDALKAQTISIKIHSNIFELIRNEKEQKRLEEEERLNALLEKEKKLSEKINASMSNKREYIEKETGEKINEFLKGKEELKEIQDLYDSIDNFSYLYNSSSESIANGESEFKKRKQESEYTPEEHKKTIKEAKSYLNEEYLKNKERAIDEFDKMWEKKIVKIIHKETKAYKKGVEDFAKKLEERMRELNKYVNRKESLSVYIQKKDTGYRFNSFNDEEIKLIKDLCEGGYHDSTISRYTYDKHMKILTRVEKFLDLQDNRKKEIDSQAEAAKKEEEFKKYEKDLKDKIAGAKSLLEYADYLEKSSDAKEKNSQYNKNLFDRARFLFKKPDYMKAKELLLKQANNRYSTIGTITEATNNFEDAIKFRWG